MLSSPGRRVIAVHGRAAAGREQDGARRDKDERTAADIDQQRAGNGAAIPRGHEAERATFFEAGNAGGEPAPVPLAGS